MDQAEDVRLTAASDSLPQVQYAAHSLSGWRSETKCTGAAADGRELRP